jgi:glutathione S-transferase
MAREKAIVLYRCPNPTNVLCPCGAVARRLGKLGLDHRTERVPYRRSSRPEIAELTRQTRVPVLVDGDEVIHDSKRILQYLDWKYRRVPQKDAGAQKHAEAQQDAGVQKDAGAENEVADEDAKPAAPSGLYNLKRWRHRKKQSS